MNLYKTALSALLLAPVVGGIGIHSIQQYQAMKEQAEALTMQTEQSILEVETLLNDELDEENIFASNVANEVIRFHVRANSDSEEDQALKLLVRDAILSELGTELALAESKEDARTIMEDNLTRIEEIGATVIKEAGYDYEINAYMTVEEFPMKAYGDLMFPAGEYEALRVDIGNENGGNWWCVMYPGLCFVDTVGGVVATDGKEEMQQVLTPEDYEKLLFSPDEDTEIEYRSLIWDAWFRNS
ncbi:MAG: stage II sporulation protein R [Lachnospiraceae bacterium]|nr:stage II sporulation protein R [Lachnospiraceae bacterium]